MAAATTGGLGWFVDAYSQHCASKGCLDQAGIQIVSSMLAPGRILPAVRLWEQSLPAPRHGRIGVFPSESIGLLHLAMASARSLCWICSTGAGGGSVETAAAGSAHRVCGAGGRKGRGQTGHPIKSPRADSPCLAIRFAMIWIVLGSRDRHLALLLCSDHWP